MIVTQKDFVYLNIPSLLDRKVWIKLPGEEGGPLLDKAWNERNERQLRSLVEFFRDSGLLRPGIIKGNNDIMTLVLRFSDFTEEGQRFVMTDAPGKWRASFDRSPGKSDSDVTYLVGKLKALQRKI
jgi:hypothetical protein